MNERVKYYYATATERYYLDGEAAIEARDCQLCAEGEVLTEFRNGRITYRRVYDVSLALEELGWIILTCGPACRMRNGIIDFRGLEEGDE